MDAEEMTYTRADIENLLDLYAKRHETFDYCLHSTDATPMLHALLADFDGLRDVMANIASLEGNEPQGDRYWLERCVIDAGNALAASAAFAKWV